MRYDHFSMLPEKAFQPRNGRQGMTLEGGGGGGPQTNTTYTSNIPEWLRPQTEALLGAATQEYFNVDPTGQITGIKPYRPFSEDKESYFAPFSQQQRNVFQEVGGMQTSPLYGSGATLTGQAGMGALGYGAQAAGMGGTYERMATDPMSMQAYMSPYMQQVVERQKLAAIEDAQRANLAGNLGAARQGTYGGARQALVQAQREAALEKQLGDIQAQGLQSSFEKAQQAQQFGAGLGLQGLGTGIQGLGTAGQMGAQLADIAGARQSADIQRLGVQREIGAEQQAREQAIIDQRIQDFALAEQYPYQQLSAYSGLLRGYSTPTTSVSQYQARPSGMTQLAGLGTTAVGLGQLAGFGGAPTGRKEGGVIKFAEGGITDTDAIEGMAEDLSIPQLQQSMRNETLPEYIGMPILANKVNQAERMQIAQAGIAPDMGQEVPIADQVTQRANQLQGINTVQTAAGGGMVAFNDGGIARFQNRGVVQYDPTTPFNRMFPDPNRRVPMTEEEKEEARRLREMGLFEAVGELTSPVTSRVKNYFSNLSGDLAGRRDLAPAPNPAVIDDYPGIDFTDADIAKATGQTPSAPGQGAPAARPASQPAPMAGPAIQAGPVGIAPEAAPLSMAEMLKQREAEQKEFVGEDPRIKKMQEMLKKRGEEPFLDRASRALQMIAAGEQLRTKGDTAGLKEAMATEAARRKAMAEREEKLAQLEGADYERRAGIFKEVAGERREEAKTKADRAFQEKLLNRKLEVQEKIAKMKPESATAELIRLARSKDPVDRQIYRDLTASKSGAMTREDAVKLALQSNPTLGYAGKEAELEETIKRILGTVSAGGYTPTAQQQSILDKYNK
jgi:hypothetical protein